MRRGALLALCLVTAALIPGVYQPAASSAAAPIARPNVLIIVTDDQRFDQLGAMPNVARLFGAEGTTYSQAYAQDPLCCPSRATLLTGRYVHNHGVGFNDAAQVAKLDQTTTLAHHLQLAGYRTALAGKFFNSWKLGTPPPFFDRWALIRDGYMNAAADIDGVQQTLTGHSTDALADLSLSMLESFEADDPRPWFLYVAPFAPHWPYIPAPSDVSAPVPPFVRTPATDEVDRSDKPPLVRAATVPNPPDTVWAAQQRALIGVDRLVGRLLARMDALGESDTVAVYLSDNGYLLGEHGVSEDKRFPYPEATRIPMLVRWPGRFAAGAVVTKPVLNADVFPTVLAATGVYVPGAPPFDGRPLQGTAIRPHVIIEHKANVGVPEWASVRSSGWQYTEWYAPDGRTVRSVELYDLNADPWLLENRLARSPVAADDWSRMVTFHGVLERGRTCVGVTGANPCP